MPDILRKFNKDGLKKVFEVIEENTSGDGKILDRFSSAPLSFTEFKNNCFNDNLTDDMGNSIEIENLMNSSSTLEDVAVYLDSIFDSLDFNEVKYSSGLWNWISVYFSEDLAKTLPANKNDGFPPFFYRNGGRATYRHKLRTAWILYKSGTGKSILKEPAFRDAAPGKADWVEGVLGRKVYFAVPAVMDLMEDMYCDENYDLKNDSRGKGPRYWLDGKDYRSADKEITKISAIFDLRGMNKNEIRSKMNPELRSL